MSIFTFLKEAGEKISDLITGESKIEKAIEKRIQQLNLGINNLHVEVDGDKAILSGQAPSNDAREKAILAAGNIAGIAEVDARLDVTNNTATNTSSTANQTSPSINANNLESTFYQVKSGDTLSKIAREFYGDSNRYNEIFKANQPMLSSPDKIYPGQTLRIPNNKNKPMAA